MTYNIVLTDVFLLPSEMVCISKIVPFLVNVYNQMVLENAYYPVIRLCPKNQICFGNSKLLFTFLGTMEEQHTFKKEGKVG
jgi:hypothetical protein